LSTVLLLLVGRFQQLFELAIFAEWLFYLLTTTTIFFYRRGFLRQSGRLAVGVIRSCQCFSSWPRVFALLLVRQQPAKFIVGNPYHPWWCAVVPGLPQ